MSRLRRRLPFGVGAIPWLLSGFGAALLAAWIVESAYFSGLRVDPLVSWGMLAGSLFAVPFPLALLYAGRWLRRSAVDERRYRRAGLWCLGGAIVLLVLNAAILAVWTPDYAWFTVAWLRNSVGMGAGIGAVIGISEARAIENALEAERSQIRAETLESRREWLDYLNGLLRHEVLNNSQVISGYTSILLRDHDLDEEIEERLEAIHRQSEDMTRITEDVRVLIEATSGEDRLRPIDLGDVLADEIADLRESYEAVDVEADRPDSVHVLADEMVRRAFSNLLANAVEHNDGDVPRVEVSVETTPETATVRIADDGPGIPESVRESLFERSKRRAGEHGLGLHLVDQLVDRYDGDVELVESGPDGSVFAVELPRVGTAERDGHAPVAAGSEAAEPSPHPGEAEEPATRPRQREARGRGNPAE